MRREGHVARMWERRGVCRVLVGKPEGNRPLEIPRHIWKDNYFNTCTVHSNSLYKIKNGRIILRWIFRKWDVGVWTGSSWLRIGTSGGLL
jgi:hypothetical protein